MNIVTINVTKQIIKKEHKKMPTENSKNKPGVSQAAEPVKGNKKQKRTAKTAIMGVMMLLVIASIAYSTAIIVLGTEGYIPLIMVAPQAAFAVVALIMRFTKQ